MVIILQLHLFIENTKLISKYSATHNMNLYNSLDGFSLTFWGTSKPLHLIFCELCVICVYHKLS